MTHLLKASNFYPDITVVDIDSSKEDVVKKYGKTLGIDIVFADSLHSEVLKTFDLIVIANWGQDHVSTYRQVSGLSSNFLIEKPLASNIGDLNFLREEVMRGKIVVTNLQWNYSGFKEKLIGMREDNRLGELCGLQLFGGAKCLVTNGIHYLALANQVIGSRPITVIAKMDVSSINPRRSDFLYYGGVAVWNYPDNVSLSMHLNNRSKVSETLRILFEHGQVEVKKGTMIANKIPDGERRMLIKPAKTLHASESSESFEAFKDLNGRDGLDVIYRRFADGNFCKTDFEPGFDSTMGILASLYSSIRENSVNLQSNNWLGEDDFDVDWNIT